MTVHQRPPFLFYQGCLDDRDADGVAIVGTRKPSAAGVERAWAISAGLAERGVTVVSGLASGIDTTAHRGALEAGGRTIAVIGTGLHRHYPAENRELQERLASEHLVLSQFWPDAAPTKTSFPMRNAVMSGYAAATVVVEAAWRSGARMQARLALEHGRPVFLLDSLLQHEWHRSTRDGRVQRWCMTPTTSSPACTPSGRRRATCPGRSRCRRWVAGAGPVGIFVLGRHFTTQHPPPHAEAAKDYLSAVRRIGWSFDTCPAEQ